MVQDAPFEYKTWVRNSISKGLSKVSKIPHKMLVIEMILNRVKNNITTLLLWINRQKSGVTEVATPKPPKEDGGALMFVDLIRIACP